MQWAQISETGYHSKIIEYRISWRSDVTFQKTIDKYDISIDLIGMKTILFYDIPINIIEKESN